MEKTFANATLLSGTVLTVFMLMIPINHLSAQNEVNLDEHAKFHKATIEKIDTETILVTIDQSEVPVTLNASTTITLGNGEETTLDHLQPKTNVYIFGTYSASSRSIAATKIVIRNKPVTDRSNLSQITPTRPTRYPDNNTLDGTLTLLGISQ
jgi:hypothetical protein